MHPFLKIGMLFKVFDFRLCPFPNSSHWMCQVLSHCCGLRAQLFRSIAPPKLACVSSRHELLKRLIVVLKLTENVFEDARHDGLARANIWTRKMSGNGARAADPLAPKPVDYE